MERPAAGAWMLLALVPLSRVELDGEPADARHGSDEPPSPPAP